MKRVWRGDDDKQKIFYNPLSTAVKLLNCVNNHQADQTLPSVFSFFFIPFQNNFFYNERNNNNLCIIASFVRSFFFFSIRNENISK